MLRRPFPAGARQRRSMMHGSQAGTTATLGLVPLTTKEEQLLWAERIRPHVPHCVTMYNNLLQHGNGHVKHGTFYVLNDCPASHAVVWEWKFSATSQYVLMFCLEEEADQLVEALGAAPFLDWRSNPTLQYIPPYLLGLVQRLAEEKGAKLRLSSFVSFTYEPQLDTEPLRLGPGLRVCLLGRAGIQRLLQHVEYESDVLLEVMYGMAQRVPYLGVYRDAGVTQETIVDATNLPYAADEDLPVAWGCTGFLGEAAKAFVEENYRRRGLCGLLCTTGARRQASLLGFIPHCFVDTNNFPSRMMMSKQVGWKYTHDAFWLWPRIPKKL